MFPYGSPASFALNARETRGEAEDKERNGFEASSGVLAEWKGAAGGGRGFPVQRTDVERNARKREARAYAHRLLPLSPTVTFESRRVEERSACSRSICEEKQKTDKISKLLDHVEAVSASVPARLAAPRLSPFIPLSIIPLLRSRGCLKHRSMRPLSAKLLPGIWNKQGISRGRIPSPTARPFASLRYSPLLSVSLSVNKGPSCPVNMYTHRYRTFFFVPCPPLAFPSAVLAAGAEASAIRLAVPGSLCASQHGGAALSAFA